MYQHIYIYIYLNYEYLNICLIYYIIYILYIYMPGELDITLGPGTHRPGIKSSPSSWRCARDRPWRRPSCGASTRAPRWRCSNGTAAAVARPGCGPDVWGKAIPIYIYVYIYIHIYIYDRRKFRSQTSDNMDRWKAEQGRGREKRKMKKSRRERVRRKKMQMREKVGKSRNTEVFFQWFVAPEGRKVGSLKRRVRSLSWPDERWKIARRCGAKHISKSKCTKHTIVGPLLEVEMSKKCTPLWREAHVEVKMHKTLGVRTTFGRCDVEKVHAVVARSTFRSENVQNTHHSRTTFGSWDV